jgi:phosphoglycolate phosphatase
MSVRTVIIFDLDGTLVDAFGDIHAALNHALGLHGLPLHSMESVRGFVGNGLSNLVRRAVPAGQQERCAAVEADLRAYYAAHPADHARIYPGMREAVEELRGQGLLTAILSNKADDLVGKVVEGLGLASLFDAVVGELPGVPLKPDRAAVRRVLDLLQCPRGVMVGDGLPDGEAARNAGIPFVGVAWGLGQEEHLARFGDVAADGIELVERVAACL